MEICVYEEIKKKDGELAILDDCELLTITTWY